LCNSRYIQEQNTARSMRVKWNNKGTRAVEKILIYCKYLSRKLFYLLVHIVYVQPEFIYSYKFTRTFNLQNIFYTFNYELDIFCVWGHWKGSFAKFCRQRDSPQLCFTAWSDQIEPARCSTIDHWLAWYFQTW
jgi:hypothetical protein